MATLGEILLSKHTQYVVDRLSKGDPVKLVAASLAGTLVTEHLSKALGIAPENNHTSVDSSDPHQPPTIKVKAVKDDSVVDAEYRVIR